MKSIIIITAALAFSATAMAQQKVLISYDQNGNRIRREIVGPKPAPVDSSATNPLGVPNTAGINGAFNVYPNPSNDVFNVALDAVSLQDKCELILTDQLGKEHYRRVVTQKITPISTGYLADGVYYLTLLRNEKKDVVKLIKVTKAGQ